MATISIRDANTGAVSTVSNPLALLQAILHGDDILVNGQTAILTNMGGNWFVNGQAVNSLFQPAPVVTGPTVAPTDAPPPTGPILSPVPVIRMDPFPVSASGSLNLTPATIIVLGIAAYFLFLRRG